LTFDFLRENDSRVNAVRENYLRGLTIHLYRLNVRFINICSFNNVVDDVPIQLSN